MIEGQDSLLRRLSLYSCYSIYLDREKGSQRVRLETILARTNYSVPHSWLSLVY